MHEKIQDVMNTAWKNYRDYRRSGDMRQYTKQMSSLVENTKAILCCSSSLRIWRSLMCR